MKKIDFIVIAISSLVLVNMIMITIYVLIFTSSSRIDIQEKIAQMIITRDINTIQYNIGGIFIDEKQNRDYYLNKISKIKNKTNNPIFIVTSLETQNPFIKFQQFPNFSDIETSAQANELGRAHGLILKALGFNMNLAPVADLTDQLDSERAFLGDSFAIASKTQNYIQGLQQFNVKSIVKHYPGQSFIVDLSKESHIAEIKSQDLFPFIAAQDINVTGIVTNHIITTGEINSEGKPCSVSEKCISYLRSNGFTGLIISNNINIKSLSTLYNSKSNLYIDLINAGNNMIIDLELTENQLKKLLDDLEQAVSKGKLEKEKIEESYIKIQEIKKTL